jgi:hypothetical protein
MDIADPEIKTILQLKTDLDPEDPSDLALQTRVLAKLTREHKKVFDELINEKVWNIHDEKGNLIPHIFKDGKFIIYEPKQEEEEEQRRWVDLFCIHCKKELTEQEIDEAGEGCPLDEGGCGLYLCGNCDEIYKIRKQYFLQAEIYTPDLCRKCMLKKNKK